MSNRYYHRNNRHRNSNPTYHAINVHFDNISMLANIIQDSQRLLESLNQNQNSNNIWNSSLYQNQLPYYMFFNQSWRNTQTPTTTTNTNTPNITTPPLNSASYVIHHLDSSGETQFDISNVHLFDVREYQLIQQPLNDICPITREPFTPTQNVMMISRCKHIFSKPSLQTWIVTQNTCPSCRCQISS